MRQRQKEPQRAPAEINSFVGGLNTDAVPNARPENTVKDMVNIEINRNGANTRRLGMDYETSAVEITTTQTSSSNLAVNTYKWENVGGDADKALLVVQCGTQFNVFDLDTTPISNGSIYTKTFTSITNTDRITFAKADDYLVAVNGDGEIYTYEYDAGTITENTDRLRVRDFWGVEDIWGGRDLRSAEYIARRPTSLTDEHCYNLRNQSWGVERVAGDREAAEVLTDPIDQFKEWSTSTAYYPSNADMVNYALYPWAADGSNPTVDRFWGLDSFKNKIGSFEAARGHFVIDVLDRGSSRETAESKARTDNPSLQNYGISLPADSTSGGAKVVSEFAGRIFYAGFSGDVTDGDSKSPNLSSYVLFSRLVKDRSDITECYQKADPTSNEDADIAATDGGYVRIDGAYNIQSMEAVGSSLIIVAQNGVWRLLGGSDYGFAADNYVVERLSNEGSRSPASIMYAEGSILFWGDNGIYTVGTDQFGDWGVTNITKDRIQDLYDAIDLADKSTAFGLYDQYDRKCRWVYNNRIGSTNETKELVLDLDLNAFYKHSIDGVANQIPKVMALAESNPFTSGDVTTNVEVNGDQVQVNGDDVQMTEEIRGGTTRTLVYLTFTQFDPVVKYTLSTYIDNDFLDWYSYDSTGQDAMAYFVTSEFPVGDNMRRKQMPYLTVHMDRTETGMETVDGDIVPANQSSVKVQARWDWSNSNKSNRWGNSRQFYRYKRHYIPEDVNDSFDTGYETIVTKDIIRGSGKSLALKFSTEPAKDFRVNGWGMIWEVHDNEGN